MKKIYLFLTVCILLFNTFFISNIKVKAEAEAQPLESFTISFNNSGSFDKLIYWLYTPIANSQSSTQVGGNTIDFSTLFSEQSENFFSVQWAPTLDTFYLDFNTWNESPVVVDRGVQSKMYAMYIRQDTSPAYYRVFVYALNNGQWTQILNQQIYTGEALQSFTIGQKFMFRIYDVESNDDIKLNIVKRVYERDLINVDSALANWASSQYYDAGYDAGYDVGYETGYDAGYDVGYETGYDAGIVAPTGFLTSVWQAIDGFLSIELLPNISFGLIVSVPLGLGLITLILNFWRKD